MKKELWIAYLLSLATLSGFAGIHRFYLNKPVTGILYLLTWGLFGVGTLYDWVTMSDQVLLANTKQGLLGLGYAPMQHNPALLQAGSSAPAKSAAYGEKTSVEHQILSLAQRNGGRITAAMVSIETKMSIRKSKKQLEKLRENGFCEIDVSEAGAHVYNFSGLQSTKSFDLD